jgi:hypothetical protein
MKKEEKKRKKQWGVGELGAKYEWKTVDLGKSLTAR